MGCSSSKQAEAVPTEQRPRVPPNDKVVSATNSQPQAVFGLQSPPSQSLPPAPPTAPSAAPVPTKKNDSPVESKQVKTVVVNVPGKKDAQTKKFTPNAGFTLVCENESSTEKLYLCIMHHPSVETFISLEPRMFKSDNAFTVSYYVFVISSNLFQSLSANEDKKSQICIQAISHINQLYNARGNPNSYVVK
jgi:hypothetical protein